jgi:serine/threonine protein kinase
MSSNSSSDLAEKPPTTGLVASKYELVRMIGRGGMGSVWEARHVSLGTKVAIKFVEIGHAESEEARSRFHNEARAAATIQSKHAIKVYDHGLLDDGRPYIVMELLVGEPLDRRLDLLQRLPLDETARLVMQVARALQQAHDAGITHRDLKPENIFLERNLDDEVDVAKVLDFGIAKIRDPIHALSASSGTKTGVLMGTPFYMSPEQARGLKSVDYRSDLWSLAVIVFRCVTGVLPFDGESLGDLLVKICAAPIPSPSSVLPGALPPQLDAWMMKALEREPSQRFQSALDLAESLAMVAGVSVRLTSRRSGDRFQTPGAAGMSHADLAARQSSGQSWRPPSASAPGAFGGPVPAITSSPLTASAPPQPQPRGAQGIVLSIMAGVLFFAAAAGTLVFVLHRSSEGPGPAASTHVSASPSVAPETAPSATSMVAPAGPVPEKVAVAVDPTPPQIDPAAVPVAPAHPAAAPSAHPSRPVGTQAVAASPHPAPPSTPPPPAPPRPAIHPPAAPLPANDPGY